MRATRTLLFLIMLIAVAAFGETTERYIVILKHRSGPAPEVAQLGGTIEYRQDDELVVTLPPGAITALREDALVHYVQRVDAPGLIGTPSEPTPEPATRVSAAGRVLQPRSAANWDSGTYLYDGAGNITNIGGDPYFYDEVQRLKRSTTAGVAETYAYDPYGNMTDRSLNVPSAISVDTATNRLNGSGYLYDVGGNLLTGDSYALTYDALSQPLSKTYNNTNLEYYVYTPSDERIGAERDGWWTWSVRDEDGKVLRQYRSSATNPSAPSLWLEDFVWRDGLLLGSSRPVELGGRRHFHLDHLGTPRLITSDAGQRVSGHDYYPFGDEATPVVQEVNGGFDREEPLKFTGHERDFAGGQGREDTHYLDYMHAREYSTFTGRFLAPDALGGNSSRPESWNRYAYVLGNPVRYADPSGLLSCENCYEGEITVWGDGPDTADHPGMSFFWERWMDHSIFKATLQELDRLNVMVDQARPWVKEGVIQAGLFIATDGFGQLAEGAGEGGYLVYTATDSVGDVIYVGFTNNLARRTVEQLAERGIEIVALPGTVRGGVGVLARMQAKGLEQALIERYGLKTGKLLNKINSIAMRNPNYKAAVTWGRAFLTRNGL